MTTFKLIISNSENILLIHTIYFNILLKDMNICALNKMSIIKSSIKEYLFDEKKWKGLMFCCQLSDSDCLMTSSLNFLYSTLVWKCRKRNSLLT